MRMRRGPRRYHDENDFRRAVEARDRRCTEVWAPTPEADAGVEVEPDEQGNVRSLQIAPYTDAPYIVGEWVEEPLRTGDWPYRLRTVVATADFDEAVNALTGTNR